MICVSKKNFYFIFYFILRNCVKEHIGVFSILSQRYAISILFPFLCKLSF